MKVLAFLKHKPVNLLLLGVVFMGFAYIFHWGELWMFVFSSLALIPMAGYIGEATEVLAAHTGPRVGGLLNATLGNAAELIITIFAIREGLLELVKASITGSILGNILLVLGMSMLGGGLRHGVQYFDRRQAGNNAILLVLAVIALVIPSVLSGSIGPSSSIKVEVLSLGVAAAMMILYLLGVIYSLKVQGGPLGVRSSLQTSPPVHSVWSVHSALMILGLSTAGVAWMSEALVSSVEPVVLQLGISEFFLGIVLIPIVGNVAEHLVAVKVALQNQMDLSVEIAISSSLQISLFVAPVLVFVSLLFGNPLQLIFNEFELLALIVGVMIAALVSADGESNWLEGAELLVVYIILALAFFLLPVA